MTADHPEVSVGSEDRQREIIDDLDALLSSLPPEIVAAVDALPDLFATTLNVTGDLAATAIVAHASAPDA